MKRAVLNDLGFDSRKAALSFLKKLWNGEQAACPICGQELELLHKKAKKSSCDWQCKSCNMTYKTIHLLDEMNEQMTD